MPFDASSMAGVIYKICNGEPEPLSSHVPLIPAEVKRVVHRALTKDRLMRYQRVADFVADLGHALELGWGISTDNRDALAELATDTVRETPQAARPRQDRETEVLPVVSEPPSEMEPATPPDPAAALTARGTQVLWHGDLLLAPPVGPLYSAPTEIPSPPSAPEARSASFQTTLSSSSGQSRRHAAVKAPGRRLLGLGALIGCTVAVFALGAYITLHSLGEGPQASGESITAATPAPACNHHHGYAYGLRLRPCI